MRDTRAAKRLRSGLLLAMLMLFQSPAMAATATTGPAIGDLPPQSLGRDRHGDPVDLGQYRGKVVVVTFWGAWCPPCRKELPVLNALQEGAGDQWLRVIAVNVDDPIRDYNAMLRQMRNYSLVLARDAGDGIAETYGVRAYPNLWIIDPQGRVASHHVGYSEGAVEGIVVEIQALLTAEMQRQQAAQSAPAAAPAPDPEA